MHPSRPALRDVLSSASPSDVALAREAARGGIKAFEALMRRYNRLVFRTVRSVVRSDAEAEDVAQEAWIAAYRHLAQFEGRASFSTWLTRIALRIAFARIKQAARVASLAALEVAMDDQPQSQPGELLDRRRLAEALERALDRLPLEYRMVLVLRDVQQLSTTETAESLGVSEENVRVRLHRSRAALRALIQEDFGDALSDVFAFDGERCARMTAGVIARLSRAS